MKLDRITDGELSILQVLWERGEATSREITTAVHEEVTDPKMASVQKLVERLEAKGCVQRDRSERAHRFRPLVSHEQFLRSRLQATTSGRRSPAATVVRIRRESLCKLFGRS
ncbi:MAG: BlaI/MecI/CopY family transcriptional regulator [Thermoguttaceae bacterium]